jgi:hypothetical protein
MNISFNNLELGAYTEELLKKQWQGVTNIKGLELQKIKGAEWSCRWCGNKIYTFAHGNILSDVLYNTSNATIRLDYGRITIRARCTNKDCKEWNEDYIDWGWLH